MTDNLPPLPEPTEKANDGVCCGNFATGGEYMSQRETLCCGQPDERWPDYYTADQMKAYARAAIEASRAAVPAGWKLVPLAPTTEMIDAGKNEYGEEVFSPHQVAIVYRDMLAAAPQQVAQPMVCKHCSGVGHTEKAGYLIPCLCQMSKADLEKTLSAMMVAPAKPEQAAQPTQDDEGLALDLRAEVFDAYENGTPCYEEPDEHGGFVGNAFVLSNETFHACADLLNRRRPVSAASQNPKD